MADIFVSLSGKDSNPGTYDDPFRTVARAVEEWADGDIIYIREGTYYEKVHITKSGFGWSQLRIQAYDGETVIFDGRGDTDPEIQPATSQRLEYEAALAIGGESLNADIALSDILDEAIFTIDAQYIEVDGIELCYSTGRGFLVEFDALLYIYNTTIHHTAKEFVYTEGGRIFMQDCVMHDGCTLNTTPDGPDGYGIDNQLSGIYVDDKLGSLPSSSIRSCEIYDVHGAAIYISNIRGFTVIDNTISNCAGAAIISRNITLSSIIRNAIFYTDDYPTNSRAEAIVVFEERYELDDKESTDITVGSNIVVGCKWGIYHTGGVHQEILPRSYDLSPAIHQSYAGSSGWRQVKICNNTLVNQIRGNRFARSSQLGLNRERSGGDCFLMNNVFYEDRGRILVWEPIDIHVYTFANNVFSKRPEGYDALSETVGNYDSVVGDPDLVNPTAKIPTRESFNPKNYCLKTSSPVIGGGTDAYDGYIYDYYGNEFIDPYDIGAIQSQAEDPRITVDFVASIEKGDKPLRVQFTGIVSSTDKIKKVLWVFGDGNSSTETNPLHIYKEEGIYTVSLTIIDINDVRGREEKYEFITVEFRKNEETQEQPGPGTQALPVEPEDNPTRAMHYNRVTVIPAPDSEGIQFVDHGLPVPPKCIIAVRATDLNRPHFALGVWGDGYFDKESGSIEFRIGELLAESKSEGRGGIWTNRQLVYQEFWRPTGLITFTENVTEATIETISVNNSTVQIKWKGVVSDDNISFIFVGGEKANISVTVGELEAGKDKYVTSIGRIDSALLFGAYPGENINKTNNHAIWSIGMIDRYDVQVSMGYKWLSKLDSEPVLGTSVLKEGCCLTAPYVSDGTYMDVVGSFDANFLVLSPNGKAGTTMPFISIAFDARGVQSRIIRGSTPTTTATYYTDVGFNIGMAIGFLSGHTTLDSELTTPLAAGNFNFISMVKDVTTAVIRTQWGGNLGHSEYTTFANLYDPTLIYQSQMSIYSQKWIAQDPSIADGNAYKWYMLVLEDGKDTGPIADFTVDHLIGYTDITLFQFLDRTDWNGLDSLDYSFDMGDGTIYDNGSPQHIYTAPGFYEAVLTVTNSNDPLETDSFGVVIEIVDANVIPTYRLDYYGKNIKVGSRVKLTNTTVPPSGRTVESVQWTLSLFVDNASLVPVATSTEETFEHLIIEDGTYHVELHVLLDDGLDGKAGGFFEAVALYPPNAYIEVEMLGGGEFNYGGIIGSAPVTVRIYDRSDLQGKELESVEIGVLNRDTGAIDAYYGKEVIDYTFSEAGNFSILMIVKTSHGSDMVFFNGHITIDPPEEYPVGMPPSTVSTLTKNEWDAFGDHTHAVETTDEGAAGTIMSTDRRGGSVLKFAAVGSALSRVYNSVKGAVLAVGGKILFDGKGSGLAGDAIAVDAVSFGPDEGVNVNLGTYHDQWRDAYMHNLIAGNLIKRGYVSSVDGDMFVGQSHDLVQDVTPGDEFIYIEDGRRVNIGDYLMFAREELFEVMQVTSLPVEDDSDMNRWILPVTRGSNIVSYGTVSRWYIGDALLNLGGALDDNGKILPDTWIEILHGRSISSRIGNSDAERAPAIVGSFRSSPAVDGFERFFALGDLKGIYGNDPDNQFPGVALGEDSPSSMYMMIANKEISIRHGGDREYLRINSLDGMTIVVENSESATGNYGLETLSGDDAGSLGAYINEGTGEIITYINASNVSSAVKSIRMAARVGEDELSIELKIGGDYGTGRIYISGLPTADPVDENALYVDNGFIKISSG